MKMVAIDFPGCRRHMLSTAPSPARGMAWVSERLDMIPVVVTAARFGDV
jgi:hypothetical protein